VKLTKEQEKEATARLLAIVQNHPEGLATAQVKDAYDRGFGMLDFIIPLSADQVRRFLRAAGAQEVKKLHGGGIRYLLIWKSPAPAATK